MSSPTHEIKRADEAAAVASSALYYPAVSHPNNLSKLTSEDLPCRQCFCSPTVAIIGCGLVQKAKRAYLYVTAVCMGALAASNT